MESRKKLLLYFSLLVGTSVVLYPSNMKQNELQEEKNYEDNDEDNAKVICKFKNSNLLSNSDVITVIDENSNICSIIYIDNSKSNNDTLIYLPEGNYRVYSSLGFDKKIKIDDIDDTYKLICDYDNYKVLIDKINDRTNTEDYLFSNLDYSNIKNDKFIPQGYVMINGDYPSILISSYSKNDKSRIYIYDIENGENIGYIALDNYDHVGGVTYDYDKDILFVTASNGQINTYNYSLLMKALKNGIEIIDGDVAIDLNIRTNYEQNNNSVIIENDFNVMQSASTVCYFDGYLYSIDFGLNSILVKTKYNVISNKIISISNEVIMLDGAKCVQGMAFYQNQNDTYLIISSSLGYLKSRISIYKVDDTYNWNLIGIKTIEDNKKIEGISVDKFGDISTIYEGNMTKSKMIGNMDDIINNYDFDDDKINDIGYALSGFVWDIFHSNDLSIHKAKKLIKKQNN